METEWISDIKNYCAKVTSFFNNEIYIDRVTEFYMYFTICIINILGNVLNMVIYNRRNKIVNSPVNLIFKTLAVTDFALSALYLFDIFINYFLPHIVKNGSYEQVLYGYWVTFISRVIHFILLWLTIFLAYWRYEALARPLQNRNRYDSSLVKKSIIAIYSFCLIVSCPYFVCIQITSSPEACKISMIREALRKTYCMHQPFGCLFWIYMSSLFSLSAIILIIESIRLFCLMRKTRKTRKTLSMSQNGEKDVEMRRTNRMILIAVILFLLTDTMYIARLLTNTEIKLLSILDDCFGNIKYFSIFLFINPSVNTLCYLTMSSQYRTILKSFITHRKTSTTQIRENFRYLFELSSV